MIDAIKAFFPRYPTQQAVTLPALHIVNEQAAVCAAAGVVEIAELLELAPAEVHDTLTFYGFFKQDKPHGQLPPVGLPLDQLCACAAAEELLDHLCQTLAVQPGETTADGRVTLEFAECLGACEHAPCMLANENAA